MRLPEFVESLLLPESYPKKPDTVIFKQTHISYIFLTPEFVYKVKKPVNFGFLDFTTLEKRKHFCEEEVRLNRRLAATVYTGVVGITEYNGTYHMEGPGSIVEYAVKMKRLPDNTMLDYMIKEESITPSVMDRIARVIAKFHKEAEKSAHITEFGTIETIKKNTEENFIQTLPYINRTISKEIYDEIKKYAEDFIEFNKTLFKERIKQGFIRDCHGDIHSEHISIFDGISVFDCIEFNERFRFSDTVSDMAFFSMDLEFRMRGDLARAFEDSYFSYSKDKEGKRLLNFYKCYRAYVRGKVEGFRLDEEEETEEDKKTALIKAKVYFALSLLYAKGGYRPLLVIIRGLTGSGKSTVANILKEKIGISVISSDAIRKQLFSVPLLEHRYERFGAGIYSEEATEKTYSFMMDKAAGFLSSGRSVAFDATFLKNKYIEAAKNMAEETSSVFRIIECEADEETVKKRFVLRMKEKETISDATFEIYKRQKELFEKSPFKTIKLPTDKPPEELALMAIEKITSS